MSSVSFKREVVEVGEAGWDPGHEMGGAGRGHLLEGVRLELSLKWG